MSDNKIPFHISDFVRNNFRSVSALEVFLLLIENHDARFTASQVSHSLRSNEVYAEDQLWELVRSGLAKTVEPTGQGVAFQSACSDRASMCEELRETFRLKRSSIINLIYSRPSEPIKDLAEGFVFGSKKKD